MATMRTMRLAVGMSALALLGGALVGCSAEAADIDEQGGGSNSGGTSGTGSFSSLGGTSGTGGVLFATGGGGNTATAEGAVTGRLRDLPYNFPDYRPRFDPWGGDLIKLHSVIDLAIVGDILVATLGADGNPVYLGGPAGTETTWGSDHPACNGQPCFNYWFNDVPGMNQGIDYTIQLVEDPTTPGKWVFDNNGQPWFPIDGQLYGNDDTAATADIGWDPAYELHNYGFTLELELKFRYQPGQVFTFIGDDDVFVYIDNRLAVNLGGIHGKETGSIALDTMGLIAEQDYTLKFFFAERNPTASNFRIETTIAPEDWVIF